MPYLDSREALKRAHKSPQARMVVEAARLDNAALVKFLEGLEVTKLHARPFAL